MFRNLNVYSPLIRPKKRGGQLLSKLLLLASANMAVFPTGEALAATFNTLTGEPPIVIGHRGASGYRPEHTLAAYELAIDQGADFIEPDLVSTKDGVLIARHENAIAIVNPLTNVIIEATTDVAERPEFAARRTTKTIDGQSITGWFTEDFTLEELKTLRAQERLPQVRPQNTAFDGQYEVPTFQEVIDLAKRKSMETGRTIGIYPETKHPSYFDSIGLSIEETLVEVLEENGYIGEDAPVFIQSFEVGNLRDLNDLTDVPLVQLLNATGSPYDFVLSGDSRTYADLATPTGLAEITSYAQGIGTNKNLLIPRDSAGNLLAPTSVVDDAHAANLLVHAWTFRNEDVFLPLDFQGNPQGEYELFFSLGIDGVFSDFPDTAVAVRNSLTQQVPEPSTLMAFAVLPFFGLLRRRQEQANKS